MATSKKTTRKRTKKSATSDATDATEGATTTAKKKAAKKTAKKATKKTTKKAAAKTVKKATKKTAAKTTKKASKKAPVKKTAGKKAGKAKVDSAGITRHEAEDGSIVIRFPPAAPSPFADLHQRPAEAEPTPTLREPDPEPEIIIEEPASAIEPEAIQQPLEPEVPAASDNGDEDNGESRGRKRRRRGGRGRGRRGRSDEARETVADAEVAETVDKEDESPVTMAASDTFDNDFDVIDEDDDDSVTLIEDDTDDEELLTVVDDDDDDDDFEEVEDEEVEVDEDEDDEDDEDEDEEAEEARPKRGARGRGRRRGRRRGRGGEAREEEETAEEDEKEKKPARKGQRDKRRGRQRGRRMEDLVPAIDDGPRERRMIINYVPRDECRIAITANDRLEEIYLERASYENHVGSIYKGVVTNVEPSIQAAFVDFGMGKNGFLHITDLHPDYMASESNRVENVGRKMPRRARPPIQKCLKRGQELIVQITKEGIGTKGPTLSTYVSIPGRFLVMMPGMRKLGISRKIEDDNVRTKIRNVMSELKLPKGIGFIARTAAEGRTAEELQADLNYLERLWKAVTRRIKKEKAPTDLYRESDLIVRTIRDVFADDITEIVVDDPEVADRARDFLSIFSPDSDDIVKLYDGTGPIFHRYGIEAELEKLHSRTVPLKSGGSLVIEATEALVAIDVNSGKFRTEDDAESTAFKINEEAADEISRQLRLRDLGGVVVCDFIDMREEKHKRDIERRLIGRLKQHKERAKVLRMSQFGIIELTRQRQRASLTRNVYQDCSVCRGTGLVKTTESVMIDVTRQIQWAVSREHVNQIEVTLAPEVADLIQNRKRSLLHQLEQEHHKSISIRPNSTYTPDQVHLQCYDQRGRQVPME